MEWLAHARYIGFFFRERKAADVTARAPPPPSPTGCKVFRDITGHINMVMKQLSASKFKEQCLALLDSVGPEGIVVTKRGKPVAKLIPYGPARPT